MPIDRRLRTAAAAVAACLGLAPAAAEAWKAPPAGVISIAEVRERAETGDYLVVSGVVVEHRDKVLFRIEDATGSLWVLIPDFVQRDEGVPARHERIRVAGKYDSAKLDKSVKGVRATTLWRDGKVNGGRGEVRGEAASATPSARPTPPAAAAPERASAPATSGEPMVIRPKAGAAFVEQASAARQEWLAALAELEDASTAYARALYEAGDGGEIDPAVRDRNDAAEARVAGATDRIDALVEEARRQGVPEDVLSLYVQITTRDR